MHPLYPKYNVAIRILPILVALPLCICYLLIKDYGRAIVMLFATAFLVAVIIEFLAAKKYNRLVLQTFCAACDGEAYAREHAKLDPSRGRPLVNRVVLQSNAANAASERGNLDEAYLLVEEALRWADEKPKKVRISILALVLHNCGIYASDTGRFERAEALLLRLSALRDGITPKEATKWGKSISENVRALSFHIRFRKGDFGDEVLFHYRQQLETAGDRRSRVEALYMLGCVLLCRGENEEAMRTLESVVAEGNTLRVAREARAKLAGETVEFPQRAENQNIVF